MRARQPLVQLLAQQLIQTRKGGVLVGHHQGG